MLLCKTSNNLTLMQVIPYKDQQGTKKEQVAQMFNSIAKRYDFLNHFLSMGIDKIWRRKAISKLKGRQITRLLDIATGTGDFAISASKIKNVIIDGIDISEQMLAVGRKKIEKKELQHRIIFHTGDSENIQFPDNSFEAITVAFGVRNFENLEKGLSEMFRVLKPGGIAVILEFSKPKRFPVKQLYNFYFKHILPLLGRMVSKDSSAYTYLPESVNQFPDGGNFIDKLKEAGYTKCNYNSLTFGIASIYIGEKPA
jgi:demethylmenaquinone methyltransferase / 2-methoxy-6-polyprenyl-1,4-benzoquinol methylase